MIQKLKKSLFLVIVIALFVGLVGCSKNDEEPVDQGNQDIAKVKLKVAALNGPTGMGMVNLMENDENNSSKLDYEFTLLASPDDLAGKIISGEVDIAAVPTNLALVLYNKTGGQVQLAAVNTLGVLYVVENGDTIHSIEDLKGLTINTTGKGASPDFIFQYIIEENGLGVDKDVILDYQLQNAELATALVAGDVNVALLPEPLVTNAMMKNQDLRIALNITEEWNKVKENNGKLPMATIIIQKKLAEENPEALKIFLEEYEESVDFVNNQIDEASELIAKFNILPQAEIAKKAIPNSNIVFIEAEEAKMYLDDFYEVLFNFNPQSVGGSLPDEGFYYKK